MRQRTRRQETPFCAVGPDKKFFLQSEERGGEGALLLREVLQSAGRKKAALHGLRMVLQPDIDDLRPVNGVGIHDEQHTASGVSSRAS